MDPKTDVREGKSDATESAGREILKLFPTFVLVTILGPAIISFCVFAILTRIDVTVLPWFGFLLVPLICLGVLVPLAVAIGRQIYRQAACLESGGALVQVLIQLSIIWIVIGNVAVFKLVSALFF